MPRLSLLRLLRTVRYLKIEQIAFQLYYRLRKAKPTTVRDSQLRNEISKLEFPAFRSLSSQDGTTFKFLGEEGTLVDAASWNSKKKSNLWLYNLHYLDDLNAKESADRSDLTTQLLDRWILENPVGTGTGWDPYPTSLRIVNIIKCLLSGEVSTKTRIDSLATQAAALVNRTERHLLGNHIFANGKALVFAGAFLGGDNGDLWLSKGLSILDREIKEQFLEDGGHFERSPMYHAILVWDMCDLVRLAQSIPIDSLQNREANWRKTICNGLTWLEAMCHADGDISFFNDAAFGIAPKLRVLQSYAKSIDCESSPKSDSLNLNSSGYFSVLIENGHKLILDAGEIGPSYQPGHAHADTLSFELSLFGCRVFVNTGTSQYGISSERLRQRKTKSHNTVEIDGQDSSEVWSAFRVGRRAKPTIHKVNFEKDSAEIEASHNGYRHLPGKNTHKRRFRMTNNSLLLHDTIEGSHSKAIARFYLHPEASLERSKGSSSISVTIANNRKVQIEITGADKIRIEKASWHPRFGETLPNRCIAAEFSHGHLSTSINW